MSEELGVTRFWRRVLCIVLLLCTLHSTLYTQAAEPPTVPYTQGVMLAAEDRLQEALGKFEEALAVAPDHHPSLFGAANALVVLGDELRALEYSARAVELDPENRWYKEQYNRLMVLLELRLGRAYRAGDVEHALAIVDAKYARPEADPMEGYFVKTSVLQMGGRYNEARRTMSAALKEVTGTGGAADSLRSEIHGTIGSLWHESERRQRTELRGKLSKYDRRTFAEYEKALALNNNNALVLNNYAYYLAEADRQLDRALGMASRAVKLRENDPTYLDTYAWVLYKLGDYSEAKKVMQRALPLDKEGNPELLSHYADILSALGDEFMADVYRKRAREAEEK